jgi:NADPH:quinone reductase-like Zn-dependent oxidoreductase
VHQINLRRGATLLITGAGGGVGEAVVALVVAGALDPSVTWTFPLDRAPEAMRAVEQGHARGKIVIEVPAA